MEEHNGRHISLYRLEVLAVHQDNTVLVNGGHEKGHVGAAGSAHCTKDDVSHKGEDGMKAGIGRSNLACSNSLGGLGHRPFSE